MTTTATANTFVWGTEVTEEGETINVVHPPVPGETYYIENVFSTEEEAWAAIAAYEEKGHPPN